MGRGGREAAGWGPWGGGGVGWGGGYDYQGMGRSIVAAFAYGRVGGARWFYRLALSASLLATHETKRVARKVGAVRSPRWGGLAVGLDRLGDGLAAARRAPWYSNSQPSLA